MICNQQQFNQLINDINEISYINPILLLDQNNINLLASSISNNNYFYKFKFNFNYSSDFIIKNNLLKDIDVTSYKDNAFDINPKPLKETLKNSKSLRIFSFKDDFIRDYTYKHIIYPYNRIIGNILTNQFINQIHLSLSIDENSYYKDIYKSLLLHDNLIDIKISFNISKYNNIMNTLIKSLQHNYSIKNLSLTGYINLDDIIKLINQNKYLETIKLTFYNIVNETDLAKLFNSMDDLEYLQSVKISNYYSYSINFVNFDKFLDLHKNLTALSITGYNITNIDYIINLIIRSQIEKLSLIQIGSLKMKHIIRLLLLNNNITDLNVSYCDSLKGYLSELFNLLKNNNSITKLNIENIPINLSELNSLCDMILTNKNLIKLNINSCFNNDIDLIKFMNTLQKNNTLLEVKACIYNIMSYNNFITSLCNLIQKNNTLTHLSLDNKNDILTYNNKIRLTQKQVNKIFQSINKNSSIININWTELFIAEKIYLTG